MAKLKIFFLFFLSHFNVNSFNSNFLLFSSWILTLSIVNILAVLSFPLCFIIVESCPWHCNHKYTCACCISSTDQNQQKCTDDEKLIANPLQHYRQYISAIKHFLLQTEHTKNIVFFTLIYSHSFYIHKLLSGRKIYT